MPEVTPSRYTVMAGWDSVPHLDEDAKAELLASTPPHLRDARSKGIPALGSGAIYPVPWEEISEAPIRDMPAWWPRAYALDVGWKRTAALWGAWDPADWTLHVYSEHYKGQAEPAIHAASIKARGEWIRGVIDPAARGRAQKDGEQLMAIYQQAGLRISLADNAVEAGLYEVWTLLSTGRLKLSTMLTNLRAEYMIYRRDVNGKVVKENDHLMDCLRYLVMSGRGVSSVRPVDRSQLDHARAMQVSDVRAGY